MKLGYFLFFLLVANASPKEGRQVERYANGKLMSERFYKNGQKVGVHRTWYANGKLRSQSEFSLQGQMTVFKDWYDNGVLSKQINFENGYEVSTKIYRKTGQIYINRIMKNGRIYGLPGGKACFRVKENGESL